jgi:K+-transporting ATPase KdpF subunit
MSAIDALSLAVALAIAGYLLYALLRGENL